MLTSALFCNCRYQHSFVAADFCTEKSAVRIRTSAKFGTCKTAKKLRTWLILIGKHWSFGHKGLSVREMLFKETLTLLSSKPCAIYVTEGSTSYEDYEASFKFPYFVKDKESAVGF